MLGTRPTRRRFRRRAVSAAAALLSVHLAGAAALTQDPPAASLRIDGPPGVDVAWEGVPLGRTDGDGTLTIEGIPPGSHQILFSKPGFESRPWRLEVEPGAGELVIELESLEPLPREREERQTEPAPPPSAEVPDAEVPDAEAPPAPAPPPEPRATRPPPAPEPAFPRAAAPAEAAAPSPFPWEVVMGFVLLALVAGIAATAFELRRRRATPPPPTVVRRSFPPAARQGDGDPDSAEVLETLRQRERDLEWKTYRLRDVSEPEVIDVVDVRVLDDDSPQEGHR